MGRKNRAVCLLSHSKVVYVFIFEKCRVKGESEINYLGSWGNKNMVQFLNSEAEQSKAKDSAYCKWACYLCVLLSLPDLVHSKDALVTECQSLMRPKVIEPDWTGKMLPNYHDKWNWLISYEGRMAWRTLNKVTQSRRDTPSATFWSFCGGFQVGICYSPSACALRVVRFFCFVVSSLSQLDLKKNQNSVLPCRLVQMSPNFFKK